MLGSTNCLRALRRCRRSPPAVLLLTMVAGTCIYGLVQLQPHHALPSDQQSVESGRESVVDRKAPPQHLQLDAKQPDAKPHHALPSDQQSVESGRESVVDRKAPPQHLQLDVKQPEVKQPDAPLQCANWRHVVYWDWERKADIEPIASRPNQFVTFVPDHGGWNNIRMAAEIAVVYAFATNRTLVMPPAQGLYLLSKEHKQHSPLEFFEQSRLAARIRTISTEQYQKARSGAPPFQIPWHPGKHALVFGSPTSTDQHWSWQPGQHAKAMSSLSADMLMAALPVTQKIRIKQFLRNGKRNPVFVDSKPELLNAQAVHFGWEQKGVRFLAHFYNYLWWVDEAQARRARRFVRDTLRYRDEIQCAAADVIAKLKKRGNGHFSALHVRRGDFQYPKAKISAEEIAEAVSDILQNNELVYIATDESDRAFFKPLAIHGRKVVFLSDLIDPKKAFENPNWIGMVEQLVCSAGRTFSGTWWSTFTGYIIRVRGYRGLQNMSYYHTPGRKYEMRGGIGQGGRRRDNTGGWWREWPTAWADV